jgi:hypothetical protein
MEIFVRTKTYRQENGFLGAVPDDWWVEYRQLATVERPGLLAQGDGAAWRVLLTGIPTRRADASERPITYSLLFEGDGPLEGADHKVLLAVVRSWLDALVDPEDPDCPLGPSLDKHLDEDRIGWLLTVGAAASGVSDDVSATEDDLEAPAAAVRAVAATLDTSWSAPGAVEPRPVRWDDKDLGIKEEKREAKRGKGQLQLVHEPWLGSVRDLEDRRRLSRAVAQLVTGEPGFAGYLNILRSVQGAAEAPARVTRAGQLCVLLTDLPHQAVQEAKKSLAVRPNPGPGPRRRRWPRVLGLLGLSLTIVILAVLAMWYLRRR